MLTACLQILVFLSDVYVICGCDISIRSFSCGQFADILTWLKKNSKADVWVIHIWIHFRAVLSAWWHNIRVVSDPFMRAPGKLYVTLNLPPAVAVVQSTALLFHRPLPTSCQSGGEPASLVKGRVTHLHFRRRGIAGNQPSGPVSSSIFGLPILVWPLWSHFLKAAFKKKKNVKNENSN